MIFIKIVRAPLILLGLGSNSLKPRRRCSSFPQAAEQAAAGARGGRRTVDTTAQLQAGIVADGDAERKGDASVRSNEEGATAFGARSSRFERYGDDDEEANVDRVGDGIVDEDGDGDEVPPTLCDDGFPCKTPSSKPPFAPEEGLCEGVFDVVPPPRSNR